MDVGQAITAALAAQRSNDLVRLGPEAYRLTGSFGLANRIFTEGVLGWYAAGRWSH